MSAPNYPGGFAAKTILVFLYADGRQNFTLGDFEGGRRIMDAEDQESLARSVKHAEVDVSGMDWGQIIQAANRCADELRGGTWTQWVKAGGVGPLDLLADYGLIPDEDAPPPRFAEELTPAGPQYVIPGCERAEAAPAPSRQLSLFA